MQLKQKLKDGNLKANEEVNVLYKIGKKYRKSNLDSSELYTKKSLSKADLSDDLKGMCLAYSSLAVIHKKRGNYSRSIQMYLNAISFAEKLNDTVLLSKIYINLGVVYKNTSKYSLAKKYYSKSLQISLRSNDSSMIANCYNNLGTVSKSKGDYKSALEYYIKANDIQNRLNNKLELGMSYLNIAGIYKTQQQYDESLQMYLKAMEIARGIKNLRFLAKVYNNIGVLNRDKERYELAISDYRKALRIREDLGDRVGAISTSINIGEAFNKVDPKKGIPYLEKGLKESVLLGNKKLEISSYLGLASNYRELKDYKKSIYYYRMAIALCKKIGLPMNQKEAYLELSEVHESIGNYKLALENFKGYVVIEDSLLTFDISKKLNNSMDSLENAQLIRENALIQDKNIAIEKSNKRQRIIFIVAIVAAILILLVITRSYFQKQKSLKIIEVQKAEVEKQKSIAEKQKEVLEIKNDEITSSIQYALRIQTAILPSSKKLRELSFENFVLFNPKDIVSGDFYWCERVDDKSKLYFTAADCTGHGVPGAMVSVVCSNALTKVIRELGKRDPGKILDEVSALIEGNFGEGDTDIADGMDLGLTCIDKKTNQLHFAGANNPIYIVRKLDETSDFNITNDSYGLIEIKADAQPIGKYFAREPFNTHTLDLLPGDVIYSFSDGYPDQFGGPKGKKYKYKPFKRFLLGIQGQSMEDQKEALLHEFEMWRGNEEQVDDVCIFGVKIGE